MYWPIGTPRIYATIGGTPADTSPTLSHDGLPPPGPAAEPDLESRHTASLTPGASLAAGTQQDALAPPPTPITPVTPSTPAIRSVEHEDEYDYLDGQTAAHPSGPVAPSRALLHEPILALRVARSGHIFAVITSTSVAIWQTKV